MSEKINRNDFEGVSEAYNCGIEIGHTTYIAALESALLSSRAQLAEATAELEQDWIARKELDVLLWARTRELTAATARAEKAEEGRRCADADRNREIERREKAEAERDRLRARLSASLEHSMALDAEAGIEREKNRVVADERDRMKAAIHNFKNELGGFGYNPDEPIPVKNARLAMFQAACDKCNCSSLAAPEKHGTTCKKEPHIGTGLLPHGYLHDDDDDTPFTVDGVTYCGRCHHVMDAPEKREVCRWKKVDYPNGGAFVPECDKGGLWAHLPKECPGCRLPIVEEKELLDPGAEIGGTD